MNLIEVLVAAVVAGVVILALGGFITANFKVSGVERERAFAMQKALQMLEEMASKKLEGPSDPGPDRYADEGLQWRLTIATDVQPYGPLSGNPAKNNVYKYVRLIESQEVPGDPYARKVTVKVWYQDPTAAAPTPLKKPLAVVAGVMRSNVASVGPKQVLDIYAINIENVPHVYRKDDDSHYSPSHMAARQNFQAALARLESSNPSLRFRVHYITRLSTGRDKYYRPYVNDAKPLAGGTKDPLNSVYFYPGRVADAADSPRYYDYTGINGNLKVDESVAGPTNRGTYPLADQFNHAVRAPLEFNSAGDAVMPDGVTPVSRPDEMSLRQLLEDLLSPTPKPKYRNAILVNLHGELFPALPLRNYSDPAKDMSDTNAVSRERRLVTHPLKLVTPAGLTPESVKLVVHPFMADGNESNVSGTAALGRVVIKDLKTYLDKFNSLDLTSVGLGDVKVYHYEYNPSGSSGQADYIKSNYTTAPTWGTGTPWGVNDLVLDLSPVRYNAKLASKGGNYWGIKTASRLYGMHYYPDPFLPFLNITHDSVSSDRPRNTAQFVVEFRLKSPAVNRRFEVITQLARAATGTFTSDLSDPANSRSWFYYGVDWDAGKKLYNTAYVPWTEQFQLLGDPRHNPYLDARHRTLYNPYFTEWLDDDPLYPGAITNKNGDSGKSFGDKNEFAVMSDAPPLSVTSLPVKYDLEFPHSAHSYNGVKYNVPAYMRMWREALIRNDMVFVNMIGEPFRYIGMGGEYSLYKKVDGIGDLVIAGTPWTGNSSDDGADYAKALFHDRMRLVERRDDTWHALPWLGELYPSANFAAWISSGNLAAGSASTNFRLDRLEDLNTWPAATTNNQSSENRRRISGQIGFASFLNAVNASGGSPVKVYNDGNDGRSTDTGALMAEAMKAGLPTSHKARYYYELTGGSTPPEWNRAPYSTHAAHEWLLPGSVSPPGYYDSKKGTGKYSSNPILLKDDLTSPTHGAIVLANTFTPEWKTHLAGILDTSVATMAEAFYDGTREDIGAFNIKPIPRVKAKTPMAGSSHNAGTIALKWFARWTRGDGNPFSPFFSVTYADPLTAPSSGGPLDIVYYVKYRTEPGTVWKTALVPGYCSSEVAAEEGVPVYDAAVTPIPNAVYPEAIEVQWDASSLTAGNYVLRIEGFRTTDRNDANATLGGHHSYHEVPVTIN